MTQMNATMTFETRRMEESITAAVLERVGPTIAQVAADLQRLTKLLEAEAVEAAEFAAVLAHSGAVSIEVAQAQAQSLERLGYRLVPGVPPSAPAPVAATWDGPTPPQAAPAVRVPVDTSVITTGETAPLWVPPTTAPDKTWVGEFE